MQFKQLFDDDRAVSPVIGVILMVAITVILAAVIGTFVLGLGDQVQTTTPQAQFSFDGEAGSTVTITHESGDTIEQSLDVKYGGTTDTWSSTPISAGDSFTTGSNVASGDTVRVVWNNPDSDSSSTLAKKEY